MSINLGLLISVIQKDAIKEYFRIMKDKLIDIFSDASII